MNKKTLKEYRIWRAMKARCYAPSQTKGYYKDHGIQVCDRWLHSFNDFLADMGSIPNDNYSLERIDVMGDYTPENCKWIPRTEQPKNRTTTIWVEHNGKKMCLKDFARETGIKYSTLYMRYRRAGNDLKAVDYE
jgi:hypothetical protein